ncbi:MAG: Signal transduction histidine kinase [Paenibacillaceae bacterium]|jgi:signal transduction histidine kinase|nr:Signal transduction histidine kinase [Paenibacillaceae bacterium]
MIHMYTRLKQTYLNPALDFRVRLFNVLAIGGTAISLIMGLLSAVNNGGAFTVAVNLAVAALSFGLLTYSRRSGRYQICYMITITAIFIVLFPVLFFLSGGYHSGMPAFFVFAVAFTIFMLEGKKAVFFSLSELAVYIAICIIAYRYPDTVRFFETEQEVLTDIIIAFMTVSVVLGVCMFLHFRLYNEQQRKLDEQNNLLAQANNAKTEFLANTSHEMRTPLTVISVNVQTVMGILEDMDEALKDPDAQKLLQNAQGEIMRLARMVGGMLTLASISEGADKRKVDLSALLRGAANMLQLTLLKRGNTLVTEIHDGLAVFGDADFLSQVAVNLIQNAHAHSDQGCISFGASQGGGKITVTVRDNGTGISPELLPRVFERGVSEGGTGFGLYLCRTVVESHGGRIWIESEPGRGTAVFFTLPVYEGQYGGDAA